MQSIETGMSEYIRRLMPTADVLTEVAPNEISKSSIPPKLVLPPPAKAKHLNHLLATLETVGVGANVSQLFVASNRNSSLDFDSIIPRNAMEERWNAFESLRTTMTRKHNNLGI